jgi:hypothetical protein
MGVAKCGSIECWISVRGTFVFGFWPRDPWPDLHQLLLDEPRA